MARRGSARQGVARWLLMNTEGTNLFELGSAGRGMARLGAAGHGRAGLGAAWLGSARRGKVATE